LERTNARLRDQLRRLDLETEAQIVARYQREQDQADQKFDPLELAIADRVGAGEETYYVPLPGAAAPVVPVAEADGEDEISRILDVEAAASAPADTDVEAEVAGTPANIDSVLREILEAEVEVHQATL
ncbi:hypothetical protein PFI49_11395, partial [Streptococcus pneumoniae]|nr:hypothetical protein [Streptococcus pneumoniae]